MVAALSLSATTVVFAEEVGVTEDLNYNQTNGLQDDYVLISEEVCVDDNGFECISKVYQKADEINAYSTNQVYKGEMTLKVENTFTKTASGQTQEWVTMWVQGKFKWDTEQDYIKVSNVTYYTDPHTSATMKVTKNPAPTYKSDQGSNILFGNKYAYMQKEITMTNSAKTYTFKLYASVNIKGSINTDPTSADIYINP